MTINLLKPALRVEDIHDFAQRQKNFLMRHEDGQILFPVWTSRRPARVDDLLNGGSVYWIIKKHIACRQEIMDFVELPPEKKNEEGTEKPAYLILCDPKLICTENIPKRPFQGWRYLDPKDAPKDLGAFDETEDRPPPEMEKELSELGLL